MGKALDNGLAARMAYHGPSEIRSVTALEAAVEMLGLEGVPVAEALDAIRDRADEINPGVRQKLEQAGLLTKAT